jgi:hypothetical protein
MTQTSLYHALCSPEIHLMYVAFPPFLIQISVDDTSIDMPGRGECFRFVQVDSWLLGSTTRNSRWACISYSEHRCSPPGKMEILNYMYEVHHRTNGCWSMARLRITRPILHHDTFGIIWCSFRFESSCRSVHSSSHDDMGAPNCSACVLALHQVTEPYSTD